MTLSNWRTNTNTNSYCVHQGGRLENNALKKMQSLSLSSLRHRLSHHHRHSHNHDHDHRHHHHSLAECWLQATSVVLLWYNCIIIHTILTVILITMIIHHDHDDHHDHLNDDHRHGNDGQAPRGSSAALFHHGCRSHICHCCLSQVNFHIMRILMSDDDHDHDDDQNSHDSSHIIDDDDSSRSWWQQA